MTHQHAIYLEAACGMPRVWECYLSTELIYMCQVLTGTAAMTARHPAGGLALTTARHSEPDRNMPCEPCYAGALPTGNPHAGSGRGGRRCCAPHRCQIGSIIIMSTFWHCCEHSREMQLASSISSGCKPCLDQEAGSHIWVRCLGATDIVINQTCLTNIVSQALTR